MDFVVEGVDLAVRMGQLPDSGLIAMRVGETGFVLCGSPEYLATRGLPAHPDELRDHEVVGYVTPDTAVRFAYRFLVDGAVRSISLPSQLSMDDGEALVGAALRSVGLVMVNDYLVDQHLANGSLVRVLPEFELPPVLISVVHLPARKLPSAARAFAVMLRRRLATTL